MTKGTPVALGECCDDMVRMKATVAELERRFDRHEEQGTDWRATHEKSNNDTFDRLFERLEQALSRPPVWVTGVTATLTTIIGVLAGALWAIMK